MVKLVMWCELSFPSTTRSTIFTSATVLAANILVANIYRLLSTQSIPEQQSIPWPLLIALVHTCHLSSTPAIFYPHLSSPIHTCYLLSTPANSYSHLLSPIHTCYLLSTLAIPYPHLLSPIHTRHSNYWFQYFFRCLPLNWLKALKLLLDLIHTRLSSPRLKSNPSREERRFLFLLLWWLDTSMSFFSDGTKTVVSISLGTFINTSFLNKTFTYTELYSHFQNKYIHWVILSSSEHVHTLCNTLIFRTCTYTELYSHH